MQRKASAEWKGGFKDGKGTISTGSGVLNSAPYGFHARFEDGPGTNPEELIGAAHAGCFSMALSVALGQAGLTAEKIATNATVTFGPQGDGFAITDVHLDLVAKIPGATDEQFQQIAAGAKANCPVSKVLNANITLTAKLEA
ncbi:OsmC family protein [Silvimonas sp. JCM 19000]